jgi:hypothetical protein
MRSSAITFLMLASALLRADDAPGWLKEVSAITLPRYGPKVNTVVLLNEEQNTVSSAGKLTTTTRSAIRIIDRRDGVMLFYEEFDAGSDKVRDFRAWTISPSGKVKKYSKNEIADVACAPNDVYNQCRRRTVSNSADVETGAVFGYESTVERQAFASQLIFHFQNSSPVRLARFQVSIPRDCELKSSSFNGAPPVASYEDGTYVWQMENLPPIEREPYGPSINTLSPWVGVNVGGTSSRTFASWAQAAAALAELNEAQAEPNEAIIAKAKSLVAGASSELDRIRAIGRFVQQANYVSVQVNVSKGGGYRPHAATEVFEKLYGDCKDKANLIRAMLKAAGIMAYPVAIFSGDRTHVVDQWPSLGVFNHAISAIRVSAETAAPAVLDHPKLGRLLFFDSTNPYVPAGYLPADEQGSLALVGAREDGDLVRVPTGPVPASSRTREVNAELKPDGAIAGHFVDRRVGQAQSEAIGVFRSLSKPDYLKSVERWLGKSIPGSTTTGVEIADSPSEFVLKGRFLSSQYAQRPQARMLVFRAALLRHDQLRLAEKTRSQPVVLDADALSETVRVALPAEFRVDEIPPPVRFSSAFGNFEANWSADSGVLVFTRKIEIPPCTVPREQYAELKKFLDTVTQAADTPVVLVK